MKDLSIYIHIPFCKEKCFYCEFLSFKGKESFFKDYQKALLYEIIQFARQYKNIYKIKTIFIGGGTPSILPIGYIGEIMQAIFENFNVCKNAEISIEVNPGALSYSLIEHFKQNNINRISIGLQTLDDDLLKKIGRIHTSKQFYKNYEDIRKIGFKNINVDLMFSLPYQTIKSFKDTLNNIIKLEPEHISCYSLILEEGTVFYNMHKKGLLHLPDDILDRKLYYTCVDLLQKNDYEFYEISNFAKKGKYCKHNTTYWTRKEYAGFGLGASSLLNEKRIKNTTILKKYINNENEKQIEILQTKDMYSEFVFLGLRMIKGISKINFQTTFGIDIKSIFGQEIDKFLKNGLLHEKEDRIYLSKRGIDLANVVFAEFI